MFDNFDREARFRAAWEAVGIARGVKYTLFTFGESVLPYYLVCPVSAAATPVKVKGKTRPEAEALFTRVHDLVTGKLDVDADPAAKKTLGSLRALGGVARFPIRVKCASMAWHALRSALASDGSSTNGAAEISEEP